MSTQLHFDDDSNELEPLVPSAPISSHDDKKPWYKRASIYWLLPAFTIYSTTIGLGIAARVKFYLTMVCYDYYSNSGVPNDDMCNNADVQAGTSQFMMMLNLCTAVPAIFVLGPLGSLSDRIGRRICLLIAITGPILYTSIVLLVGNKILGLNSLLIGSLFEGLSGGFFSIVMASHAYATDCSLPAQRSVAFGLIQGALFIGIAIGPVLGGWIVKITNDLLSVFYVMFVIYVMLFTFFLLIMPESLIKPKHQELNDSGRARKSWINRFLSLIYNVFEPLTIFFPSRNHLPEDKIPTIASKYSLLTLTIINILLSIAMIGIQSVFLLYVTLEFKWSLVEQGYFLFMMGATRVFVLLGLFPALVSRFKKLRDTKNVKNQNDGSNNFEQTVVVEEDDIEEDNNSKNEQMRKEFVFDVWIFRLAILVDAFAYHTLGLTSSSTIFIGAVAVASLGSVASPTIKSLQTNLVAPSKTGELLGAISVLDSMIRVIAPIIFNNLYSILVKTSPHFIWYGISFSFAIAFLFSFVVGPRKYN